MIIEIKLKEDEFTEETVLYALRAGNEGFKFFENLNGDSMVYVFAKEDLEDGMITMLQRQIKQGFNVGDEYHYGGKILKVVY